MSPLLVFLLVSVASMAHAETGGLRQECPDSDWKMYRDHFEHTCLKLMPEPKLFLDAVKACDDVKARLLSLQHKRSKINFVNDLILKMASDNTGAWFVDHLDLHEDLVFKGHNPPHVASQPRWFVMNTNPDRAKIEISVNTTDVPRKFICEAPPRPAAQRPQLVREPEDVLISEEPIKEATTPATKDVKPFIITFNCQAYGIPKPTVQWVMTKDDGEGKMTMETIDTTIVHDSKLPEVKPGISFFNLQRDCNGRACPTDSIQERSQLIIVNANLLDRKKRIACVASNDFGSVLSREAQFFITKIDPFVKETESVSVKSGSPLVIPNQISSDPDAAFIDCSRVMNTLPVREMPMEEVNFVTRGGIQLSTAKFELIIDAASPEDAGKFICRVRLQNGRLGHILRERVINLDVTKCEKSDATCDTATKPVSVVQGYPAVLSTNFLSNRVIRSGDDFRVECPCVGKRRPDEELLVEWNLNNKTDLIVEAVNILPKNSAILIRNADPKLHNGLYQCRCMRGTEASAWSSTQIAVLPLPAPESRDVIRVKAGQTAVLECSFQTLVGADSSVTVSVIPMRGAKPLSATLKEEDVKRFKTTQTGPTVYTMTIADVKETDADVYGCRVIANYMGKWFDYNTYYTTLIVEKVKRRR